MGLTGNLRRFEMKPDSARVQEKRMRNHLSINSREHRSVEMSSMYWCCCYCKSRISPFELAALFRGVNRFWLNSIIF